MKTIKIIDLLNKIANGDIDTPDYIEYYNRETGKRDKLMVCEDNIIYYMNRNALFLNDEVEIIEEDNKIKKITMRADMVGTLANRIENLNINQMAIEDKINEIIDYIEPKYTGSTYTIKRDESDE